MQPSSAYPGLEPMTSWSQGSSFIAKPWLPFIQSQPIIHENKQLD
jgi:hypothetical protein